MRMPIPLQKLSTISIRNATRSRLKKIGSKGQTYDQLINDLLDLKNDKINSAAHGGFKIETTGSPSS
jgi:hypothetical protein